MNVKIQSVKFDADKRLVDFIQAKMDKMQQGGYRQDRRSGRRVAGRAPLQDVRGGDRPVSGRDQEADRQV